MRLKIIICFMDFTMKDFIPVRTPLRAKVVNSWIMSLGTYEEVDGFRFYYKTPWSFAVERDTMISKRTIAKKKKLEKIKKIGESHVHLTWDDLTNLCTIRKEIEVQPRNRELLGKLQGFVQELANRIPSYDEFPPLIINPNPEYFYSLPTGLITTRERLEYNSILLSGDVEENPGPSVGCEHVKKNWTYDYVYEYLSPVVVPFQGRFIYSYYVRHIPAESYDIQENGQFHCYSCTHRWFRLIVRGPEGTSEKLQQAIIRSPGFPVSCISQWIRDLTEEGVEPNPGPVSVLRSKIKYFQRGDETAFLLPNGKNFVLPNLDFDFEGHLITFHKVSQRIHDELAGVVSQDSEFVQNLEGSPVTLEVDSRQVPLIRSTIWSDHENFDPDRRLGISFSNKFIKEMELNGLDFVMDEDVKGRIFKMQNFILLPKDALKVKFSKKIYNHLTTNYQLYLRVRSSVINQTMTIQHIVKMAANLAVLQMTYLNYPEDRESIFGLFSILFDKEICYLMKNGPSQNNNHSVYDLWEVLFQQTIFIPTGKMNPGEKMTDYSSLKSEGEFQYTCDHFMKIAQIRFGKPEFPEEVKELVEKFKSGYLTLFHNLKPFVLNNNRTFQPMQTSPVSDLNDLERAVIHLVEDRMHEDNILNSVNRMLDYACVRCSRETLHKIVKKLSGFDILAAYNPGLQRAFNKVSKSLAEKWPDLSYEQIEYVKKYLNDERIIATVAQAEFQTWCAVFGQPTQKKYFNNIFYIKSLALLRRGSPKLKMMKMIKAPIDAASNFFNNVSTIASNATNISDNLTSMRQKFTETMQNRGMVQMVSAINEVKFESFKDSFASLKLVINAWFSDFAERICDLFGVEYVNRIDATKLLFYYIVWQHTESFPLQVFIISEVLIELGIFDFVMTVIKKIALAFRDLFRPTDRGLSDVQKEALDRMKNKRVQGFSKLEEKIKAAVENQPESELGDDNDLISDVIHFLSEASPTVLGVAGTVLISCFGLTPFSHSKPGQCFGEKIVQSARNISFLSMSLVALPKIYENIVKVVYGVIDYAKELFCENHVSSVTYHKQVEQWLKKATYSETASKSHLVSSLDAIITYFHYYGEMQELRKRSTEIKSALLMQQFEKRCRVLEDLYQVALSAGRIMLGNREIFHIQLYSPQGGVGKTDAATNLLSMIKKEYSEYDNKIRELISLKPNKNTDYLADVYPLKESLKHNDMYYGQRFGYIDEDLVNAAMEPETVLDKMVLLSGFPAISQQASISDKGRVFELQVLLSNTNNPKLPIKDMFNKGALFRRRLLVKVTIKPEVVKHGVDENNCKIELVDDEKCEQLGYDRSKGDHLLFDFCNSLTALPEPGEPFVNMDMAGFIEWSVEKMKGHFVREENRLFTKNSDASIARLQFDALQQDLKLAYGGVPDNLSFLQLRESLQSMKKFLKTTQKPSDRINAYLNERLEDLEVVAGIQTMTSSEIDRLYGTIDKGVEMVNYKLVSAQIGEETCWTLVSSEGESPVESGDIDFSKFGWDDDHEIVYYKGNDNAQIVGYWLLMFKNTINKIDFERRRKILELKQRKAGYFEVWKAELKNVHYATYRALEASSKWILSQTVEMISKGIIGGIATAVAITAMFFGLRVIGMLLAPTDKAYSNKQDKRIVKLKALETSFDQDIELAKKSIFRIKIQDERGFTEGNLTAIVGTIFLVNAHVIGEPGSKTISIYDPTVGAVSPEHGWKSFEINAQHISYIPNCDAALIDTRGYRPTRKIIHHFVTEDDLREDMTNFHTGHHSIITVDRRGQNQEKLGLATTGFYPGYPHRQYTGSKFHKRVIKVNYDREIPGGWSGGLAIHANPKISPKFIGIVLSQDMFNGVYIGVVSKEEIQRAAEKFPPSSRIITPEKDLVKLKSSHRLYDVFDLKENLFESPIRSQAVSESLGFIPTQIHGCVPVETEPAIQHINDSRISPGARHFLSVSLNKTNGFHEPFFTLKEEKFMKNFLRDTYVRYVPQVGQVRTLTTQDAIKGVKMMGSTSINTKSSAGLPYKLEKGVVGKSPFIKFNDVQKTWEIQQRVFEEVERYESLYHSGRTPNDFKMEFRKKELVGHNKIENPKTRTVATGNFINQIVYDKNFKDLYRLVKNVWENGGTSPFALGVDPERHWDQIAKHLKYTDYVIDFDVKAWEEKVCLPLLMLTADVKIKLIEDAYRSRNQKPPEIRSIVEGLAVDYTDTFVVFEDMVYRKKSGLLSGHPGTFMENSEIHEVILALLIYRILLRKAPSYATVQFIQEHVRSIKAADDIQIALSPLARRIISISDIVEGYNALGFELTAADKGTHMMFKQLKDSQFLKNGFREVEDEYQCLPNKSIIYQLLNWMRTDTALSHNEQFDVNIQNAFRFLFWHGEDEYEAMRSIVNEALLPFSRSWPLDYYQMAVIMKLHLQESAAAAHSYMPAEQEEDFY